MLDGHEAFHGFLCDEHSMDEECCTHLAGMRLSQSHVLPHYLSDSKTAIGLNERADIQEHLILDDPRVLLSLSFLQSLAILRIDLLLG